jgi:hypothetical protein
MKSHGMIFTGESVRALLAGTKTQTRTLLTHPLDTEPGSLWLLRKKVFPGDTIWAKEAWQVPAILDADNVAAMDAHAKEAGYSTGWSPVRYEDGRTVNAADYIFEMFGGEWGLQRYARHMPEWASRLTLLITDVRVQRLQEISEEDAKAEGVQFILPEGHWYSFRDYTRAYAEAWNAIQMKRPKAKRVLWEQNPWVVAITFTKETA